MSISSELLGCAEELNEFETFDSPEIEKILEIANKIGRSFSGSWFGYHSRVYYEEFKTPPPGATFSLDWGLDEAFGHGSCGNWKEYNFDFVVNLILSEAGNPEIEHCFEESAKAKDKYDDVKSAVLSLIQSNFSLEEDSFLKDIVEKTKESKIISQNDFINYLRPTGEFHSHDTHAIQQGQISPPHCSVIAKYLSVKSPFEACKKLKKNIKKIARHIQNIEKKSAVEKRIGTKIFIGHGNAPLWKDLKDFISERLQLPWEEFNRVSAAGVSNIARLTEMLDQASFAFLVMTAEDLQADRKLRARMNVVHEAGLFQGRLGFEKAIVLLEDGCEEFSNIQGLGQIRFPSGDISAKFEEIRRVLERERILR